ncbi:transcription elongation factor SPT6 [Tanacetum coccineum]
MSDSSNYSNMSDLDDIADVDLVMQLINEDQQMQGESARGSRKAINRERDMAEARLMADYFGPSPKYPDYYFRRRYRMNRSLFLEIVQGIENYIKTHDPLPAHFKFFVVRPDVTGLMSFSVIMKYTSVIRQLAYDTSPDALVFKKPDVNDIRKLYDAHNRIHGLPRMLDSIDCMHWEWINCPKAWHGQFERGDKKYLTIMLEAVASYDLWIWHVFFGVAGANNDLTVLNHSPLFDDLLDDIAQVVPYDVNGVTFEKGYYLADGIYHNGQLLSNHLRLHEMREMPYLNVVKKVLEKTLKELLVSSKVVGI